MAEIINLKRARKDKARRDHDSKAAANRQLFGRTKAQKIADEADAGKSRRLLDGKKIEPEKP